MEEEEKTALRHYKWLTEEEKKEIPEKFFNKEREIVSQISKEHWITSDAFEKLITYSRNDKIMAKDLLVLDYITDANIKYAKDLSTKKRLNPAQVQSLDKVASSTMKRMAYINEQKRIIIEQLNNEWKDEKDQSKIESNIKVSF